MKINVTQADITTARQAIARRENSGRSCLCPLARAIRRAFKAEQESEKYIGVFPDSDAGKWLARVGVDPRKYYRLPKRASLFGIRFDSGEPVEPFSFSLDCRRGLDTLPL
jgi:hypothetical protein